VKWLYDNVLLIIPVTILAQNIYSLTDLLFCNRHILASLHFNENIKREARKTKEGNTYYKVTWPKFKQGEEVVREVSVPHTYSKLQWMYNKVPLH